QQRRPPTFALARTGDSTPGPAEPPGREADPAAAALADEQLRRVLTALDPVDRQFIELRLQGYKTAEAARRLGMDPAALRVRLARLRTRLRDRGLLDDLL